MRWLVLKILFATGLAVGCIYSFYVFIYSLEQAFCAHLADPSFCDFIAAALICLICGLGQALLDIAVWIAIINNIQSLFYSRHNDRHKG